MLGEVRRLTAEGLAGPMESLNAKGEASLIKSETESGDLGAKDEEANGEKHAETGAAERREGGSEEELVQRIPQSGSRARTVLLRMALAVARLETKAEIEKTDAERASRETIFGHLGALAERAIAALVRVVLAPILRRLLSESEWRAVANAVLRRP